MKKIFLISLPVFLFFSCSKYEEGPWLTFKSKTERITNTWQVAIALTPTEEDITADFNRQFFTFTKDGKINILFAKTTPKDSLQGTWFFSDNKKNVNWELNATSEQLQELGFVYPAQQVFEILRLQEDELWLKDTNGGRLFFIEKNR